MEENDCQNKDFRSDRQVPSTREALRLMEEGTNGKSFNVATIERVRDCPLDDEELYRVLRDAKDTRKGPGWVWNTIKGMVEGRGR